MLAEMLALRSPRPDLSQKGLRIWRNFITADERLTLLDWALEMRPYLNGNGPGRQFRQTDELPAIPDKYQVVRLRLQQQLRLPAIEREPVFGWYLSIIDGGGSVHSHIDPTQPNARHLRCNVFLQLPQSGGHPVIEGHVYEVGPCDMLVFFPSEKRHRSQQVEGSDARVVCSFGYLVPQDYRLPALGDIY